MFKIGEMLFAIRTASNQAYAAAEWFAGGGAYHAYYMWFGGNNYGRTASSGIATIYMDDAPLHSDGTPNEPKYTLLSRLQHLIANHAEGILSQDPVRIPLPCWNGTTWTNGSEQFVYSYPSSINFVINQFDNQINVLFRNENISIDGRSVHIYDDNVTLLWNSAHYSDIESDNTELVFCCAWSITMANMVRTEYVEFICNHFFKSY